MLPMPIYGDAFFYENVSLSVLAVYMYVTIIDMECTTKRTIYMGATMDREVANFYLQCKMSLILLTEMFDNILGSLCAFRKEITIRTVFYVICKMNPVIHGQLDMFNRLLSKYSSRSWSEANSALQYLQRRGSFQSHADNCQLGATEALHCNRPLVPFLDVSNLHSLQFANALLQILFEQMLCHQV